MPQADHTATADYDLALRSELNFVVQPGSHRALSFAGVESRPPDGGSEKPAG